MAIKLLSVNGIENSRIMKYIVDIEDEKDNIPEEDKVQGTEVLVIEGGKRYRLDYNLQWVEIKTTGGGGSGGPTINVESLSVTQNGTVTAPYGKAYNPVNVNVANTYVATDEGKVVNNGVLVTQTARSTITQNGIYDTTLNDSVEIGVLPTSIVEKNVNFIDYDGTILYSYTKEEFANLSELPENPTHTDLIAQGWNWTKEQITAQLTAIPDQPVWVGQMYITQSGDTEIDVYFSNSARLSPIMTIAVNGAITVDWGDNTTPDTVTGNSLTTSQAISHTYTEVGNYTIVIHVVSGKFTFYGSSILMLLRKTTTLEDENFVYANTIQSIRIGNGITNIGDYAFYSCFSLASITIPSNVMSIGNKAFNRCFFLTSVTIPSGTTNIGDNAFNGCYSLTSIAIPSSINKIKESTFTSCISLTSITIPSSVTNIGNNAFSSCRSFESITIPSNVTSIEHGAFSHCYSLTSIVIQSSVTSIDNNAFIDCYSLMSIVIPSNITSIETRTFFNCVSFASITIPSNITNIEAEAFRGCSGLGAIHFKSTTPPTVANSNAWTQLPTDCVIYVPSGQKSTYMLTTNYPAPGTYLYVEEA